MKKLFQITLGVGVLLGSIALMPEEASAVTIGPDKYYIELGSNSAGKKDLTIYGDSQLQEPQKLFVSVMGMKKVGEEDDREFYVPDKNNPGELANSIQLSTNEVTIEPGKDTVIQWELTSTANIKCGTNLAAIMVAAAPSGTNAEGATVGIINNVISQVHFNAVQANGQPCPDNKIDLSLLEFKVDSKSKFFSYPNVPLLTRIENKGNLISRSPEGYIEIFGYGDKVTIPFNEEQLDIYPGTTRKFNNQWLDPNYPKDGNFFKQLTYEFTHLRIGKYQAKLGISRNVNPQIVATTTFWIIPWKVILTVLAILLIITFLVINNFRNKREIKSLKNPKKL